MIFRIWLSKIYHKATVQSSYGEDVIEIASEELDIDGFFEDDVAPQSSNIFNTEWAWAREAVNDYSAGLDGLMLYQEPNGFIL